MLRPPAVGHFTQQQEWTGRAGSAQAASNQFSTTLMHLPTLRVHLFTAQVLIKPSSERSSRQQLFFGQGESLCWCSPPPQSQSLPAIRECLSRPNNTGWRFKRKSAIPWNSQGAARHVARLPSELVGRLLLYFLSFFDYFLTARYCRVVWGSRSTNSNLCLSTISDTKSASKKDSIS